MLVVWLLEVVVGVWLVDGVWLVAGVTFTLEIPKSGVLTVGVSAALVIATLEDGVLDAGVVGGVTGVAGGVVGAVALEDGGVTALALTPMVVLVGVNLEN